MNWKSTISVSLFLLLCTLPFFLGFYVNIFDHSYYPGAFSKYGVDKLFDGLDMREYNSEVLDYIGGKSTSMPVDIELNEREISHMKDVRDVILTSYSILGFILTVIIIGLGISFHHYGKVFFRELSRIIFFSGATSFLLSIAFAFLFLFFFNFSFSSFHVLFFDQGTWMFAETDNLINIYPSGVFYDLSIRIFLTALGMSFVMVIAGFFLTRKYPHKLLH